MRDRFSETALDHQRRQGAAGRKAAIRVAQQACEPIDGVLPEARRKQSGRRYATKLGN